MSYLTDLPDGNIKVSSLGPLDTNHSETNLSSVENRREIQMTTSSKHTKKSSSKSFIDPKKGFISKSARFFDPSQTAKELIPGPGTYNLSKVTISSITSYNKKGTGNGFVSKNKRFNDYQLFSERYKPGPGEYKDDNCLTIQSSVKHSLHGKGLYTNEPTFSLKKDFPLPGPTAYNPSKVKKDDTYLYSGLFKSSQVRFPIKKDDNPEPGRYQRNNLYYNGNYIDTNKNSFFFLPEVKKKVNVLKKLNIKTQEEVELDVLKSKEKKENLNPVKKRNHFSPSLYHSSNLSEIRKDLANTYILNEKDLKKKRKYIYIYESVPDIKKKDKFSLAPPRWKNTRNQFSVPGPAYYNPSKEERQCSFNQSENIFY